jgi:hypothetical protein
VFILKFIVLQADQVEIEFRDNDHIIQGAMYLGVSIICTYTTLSLVLSKHNRDSIVKDSLVYFFLVSTIATLVQGIFNIYTFTFRSLQTLFTDSVYILMLSSSFALCLFILEVFEEGYENSKNRKFLIIVLLIISIAVIFPNLRAIFWSLTLAIDSYLLVMFR